MGTFRTKILQQTQWNRTDRINCLKYWFASIMERLILSTFSILTLLCHNLSNSMPSIVGILHVSNTQFLDRRWDFETFRFHKVHRKSYLIKVKDFYVWIRFEVRTKISTETVVIKTIFLLNCLSGDYLQGQRSINVTGCNFKQSLLIPHRLLMSHLKLVQIQADLLSKNTYKILVYKPINLATWYWTHSNVSCKFLLDRWASNICHQAFCTYFSHWSTPKSIHLHSVQFSRYI